MDFWKMLLPPGIPGAQLPGIGTVPTPFDDSLGIKSSMPFSLPGSSGGGQPGQLLSMIPGLGGGGGGPPGMGGFLTGLGAPTSMMGMMGQRGIQDKQETPQGRASLLQMLLRR
jgi:hypothetical protein